MCKAYGSYSCPFQLSISFLDSQVAGEYIVLSRCICPDRAGKKKQSISHWLKASFISFWSYSYQLWFFSLLKKIKNLHVGHCFEGNASFRTTAPGGFRAATKIPKNRLTRNLYPNDQTVLPTQRTRRSY